MAEKKKKSNVEAFIERKMAVLNAKSGSSKANKAMTRVINNNKGGIN